MSHRPGLHIVRAVEVDLQPFALFDGRSQGFRRWTLSDQATSGAVRTGLSLHEIAPGGHVDEHAHTFEETFLVLEGTVAFDAGEASTVLETGDYGLIPIGAPHAWRNVSPESVRWVDLQVRSKPASPADETIFLGGHPEHEVGTVRPAAVVGNLREAGAQLTGPEQGATLSQVRLSRAEPGDTVMHATDIEQTILVLHGALGMTFGDDTYQLQAGDAAFVGDGSPRRLTVHGDGPAAWLEASSLNG